MFGLDEDYIKEVAIWFLIVVAVICGLFATKDIRCLWFLLLGVFIY